MDTLRLWEGSWVMSTPSISSRPSVKSSTPAIIFSVEVLPAPEGPRMARNSRSRHSMLRSSTAVIFPLR